MDLEVEVEDFDVVVVLGEVLVFFSFKTLGFFIESREGYADVVVFVVDFFTSGDVGFLIDCADLTFVGVDVVVEDGEDFELAVVPVGLDIGRGLKEDVRGLYEPAVLGVDIGLALGFTVFPAVAVLLLVGVVGVVDVFGGLDFCKEVADFLGSAFLTVAGTLAEVTLGVGFALIGFELVLDETGLFCVPTSLSAFPPAALGAVLRTLTAAFPAEADLDPVAGLLVSGVTESFFSWSFSSI